MAVGYGIATAYDLAAAQLAPPEWNLRRIIDYVPGWSWQIWVILGLAIMLQIVFAGAFRRDRNQASAKNGDGDSEVDWAIGLLREQTVVYGENNTLSLDRVFLLLAGDFAMGVRSYYPFGDDPFDTKIGEGWSEEAKRKVFEQLVVVGAVKPQYRQPAAASATGTYRSILGAPYYVYTTTELGRRIFQQLSSNKP